MPRAAPRASPRTSRRWPRDSPPSPAASGRRGAEAGSQKFRDECRRLACFRSAPASFRNSWRLTCRLLARPADLELQLVHVACALVLDAEVRVGGHVQALAGHLDVERLAALHRVRQASQLRDELRAGVDLLDVSLGSLGHRVILPAACKPVELHYCARPWARSNCPPRISGVWLTVSPPWPRSGSKGSTRAPSRPQSPAPRRRRCS